MKELINTTAREIHQNDRFYLGQKSGAALPYQKIGNTLFGDIVIKSLSGKIRTISPDMNVTRRQRLYESL